MSNTQATPNTFDAAVLSGMTISALASIIRLDWTNNSKNGVNYAAKPYLDAMSCVNTVTDRYGVEDGKTQVLYFLANAQSYRGDLAKMIKAELKKRCGLK